MAAVSVRDVEFLKEGRAMRVVVSFFGSSRLREEEGVKKSTKNWDCCRGKRVRGN